MKKTTRDKLRQLGFDLGRSLGGMSQGATSATAPDGTPVVLKWSSCLNMADRYAVLLPALDELRNRGVPVPEYLNVMPFNDGTLSVQRFLPGRSEDNPSRTVVDEMVQHIAAQAGISGPEPTSDQATWGALVVSALTRDHDELCMHESLRTGGRLCAAVLTRIEAIGVHADPSWFPDNGLVHFDLHTDNILVDGHEVSAIIDWEEACAGDYRYDLVQFAFDIDGHGQSVWDIVEAADIDRRVLRAYIALLVLKCTSAAIRDRPEDIPRQLDRAARLFDRCGA